MNRIILFLFVSLFFVSCGGDTTTTPETDNNRDEEPPVENVKKDYSSVSDEEKKMAGANFLLPSPGEALTALGKLGKNVEWYKLGAFSDKSDYDNKADRALNLGVRVADAFVAINSKDKGAFGKMSKTIFEIGDDLGIADVLKDSKNKLNKLVDNDQWKSMQAEMDNIHEEAQRKFADQNEEELVVLASLGGWMEGLSVASGHLKSNYNGDNSKLLCQGKLLDYYKTKLNGLSSTTKNNANVKAAIKAVGDLFAIVGTDEDKVVSKENVTKMHNISNGFIKSII